MLRGPIVAVVVVAVLALTRSVAYPCVNEVRRTDPNIGLMATIEAHLDAAEYRQATALLQKGRWAEGGLANRAADARAVIAIRVRTAKDNVAWTIDHFKKRTEDRDLGKDVRYRAWLAEAYAANAKVEQALEILVDLKKRDLMPDHFAFLLLGKLSTGAERDAALEQCRKRTTYKAICTIPAEKAARS